jgi:hypothetical protein
MIDTLETDAQSAKCCLSLIGEFVPADFSRKIERERNRGIELIGDYERDKRQIGKDLGLGEDERLHHKFQRRIIFDLQRENQMMKAALGKIHERMIGPANNRTFMQIAGPARECINLSKPFINQPK